MLSLDVYHFNIIVQGVEGGGIGEIVDEEEGIGRKVRAGPEGTVFFLTSGVGEGEMVGQSIDGAGDRVGVFDGGIVAVCNSLLECECQSMGEEAVRRLTHESIVIGRDEVSWRICLFGNKELLSADESVKHPINLSSCLLFSNIPHPPSPQIVIDILSDMIFFASTLHPGHTATSNSSLDPGNRDSGFPCKIYPLQLRFAEENIGCLRGQLEKCFLVVCEIISILGFSFFLDFLNIRKNRGCESELTSAAANRGSCH